MEIKGPPKNIAFDAEGQPTKAGAGFARSQGVSQEELFVKSVQGVEYLFARKFYQGQATVSLLPEVLSRAILALSFPNMRWGETMTCAWSAAALDRCFVWLRRCTCFQSGALLRAEIGVTASSLKVRLILNHADEYVTRLADGYVMVEGIGGARPLLTKSPPWPRHKGVKPAR